ncbi:hypothetical protein CDQ91_03520 [Sphingopyxis witflariensis]|uniref:TonB C-terminal domain-containing protein n=1 Tax=Sphingopyxis witflariensis TaxID=173675 RepID=A0A246K644_9SPHN|nr:hypothetical protein CDQ91_03520 [Sphingopyxis witflariensis]
MMPSVHVRLTTSMSTDSSCTMKVATLLIALFCTVGVGAQSPSCSMPDAMLVSGLPLGTTFRANSQGHFTSCLPPSGKKRSTAFEKSCTNFLMLIGQTKSVTPINPQAWRMQRPGSISSQANGTTVLKLHISSEGKPETCLVITSSGHPILDEAACRQMTQQADFLPAMDCGGNPIASTYTRSVVWK